MEPQPVSIPTRGNTLFRAHVVPIPSFDPVKFQSPLGETPCSWPALLGAAVGARRYVSIPTRGNTLVRVGQGGGPGSLPQGGVSIPTRGNTLVRVRRNMDPEANLAEFQSPRGETLCSGLPGLDAPRGRGQGFNPHSGKHSVPGARRKIGENPSLMGFNPHSGKHPVPGEG